MKMLPDNGSFIASYSYDGSPDRIKESVEAAPGHLAPWFINLLTGPPLVPSRERLAEADRVGDSDRVAIHALLAVGSPAHLTRPFPARPAPRPLRTSRLRTGQVPSSV